MVATRMLPILWRIYVLSMWVNGVMAAYCSEHQDCNTCSSSSSWWSSCRWCPLTRECHSFGSLYNHCSTSQSIVKPNQCYDTVVGSYNASYAYLNTLLSAAAYASQPQTCIDKILPNLSDFTVSHLVGRLCNDLDIFGDNKCFAYTGYSNSTKTITVAFKGSGSLDQVYNIFTSAILETPVDFVIGGTVQAYFASAYEQLNPCIEQSVKELVEKYPTYKVVVTGYSLGGAIASMTAAALVHNNITTTDNTALYVFGTPRVGDKNFAYAFGKLVKQSWRIVHDKDPVSQVPPCDLLPGCVLQDGSSPYHHGIEIYYPGDEMNVDSEYTTCKGNEDTKCSSGQFDVVLCGADLDKCAQDHLYYFGKRVGDVCFLLDNRFRRHANTTVERLLYRIEQCSIVYV